MASQEKTFSYTANDIKALELSISAERLQPYVVRAGGSQAKAILIYERNTALSEALYGVTQALEIALRNAVHRALAIPYGSMWFDSVGLGDPQSEKVANAKFEIARNNRALTPGGIIAELNLGFWTSLISARYEKTLWVPHLYKSFPYAIKNKHNGKGSDSVPMSRSEIFEQLERARTLRNRIAHHESILKLDLNKVYSETLESLKWVCPTSSEWVRSTNCFSRRFYEKPLTYATPTLPALDQPPRPGMPAPLKIV